MNFKNFKTSVLAILGISKFHEQEGKKFLTPEEKAKLKSYDFSDRWIEGFEAHLNAPEDGEGEGDQRSAVIATILGQTTERLDATSRELEALKASTAKADEAHEAAIKEKESMIASLQEKIKTLSSLPEPDGGKSAGMPAATPSGFNLEDTHQLGGMAGSYNSMDRTYNQRARAAMLAARGIYTEAPAASSVDFKNLQEDLGAFYRTSWNDRLVSFLTELPTITTLFPTESGHQDLSTLVNVFLGEFSQADSSGQSDFAKVAKGSFDFGTETLRMYGVMFVHVFRSLKDLEKSWIGHLNREGSSPVKLSFIEYLLVEVAKKLHNEREQRWINGIRKDPDPDKPGRAMEAADGIYEYLRKRVDGYVDFTPNGGTLGKTVYQIKPFDLPEINSGNIGEVFFQGTSMIPAKFRDTGKVVLYIPSWMLPLYHRYNEMKYGKNVNYVANEDYVHGFPGVKIKALPNADNHHRIFWTIEGNIKTYDQVAGEMLRFNMEQQDWSIKVWSNWKESIQAEAVGRKYLSKTDVDGENQLIWCNQYDLPANFFLPADKDKNPSVALHNSLETAVNSAPLAITDIEDAKVGGMVNIKAGSADVTIKKADKFSLLTADWTPAKGDVITLMKRADGKFVEISRHTAASDSYIFPADATTPSVKGATTFITGANTKATAITDLEDAVTGIVYTIHGSGSANATTIANSGKFVLTAAMTLSDGKLIRLVKADDGKFYEVERV
ncbi:MAG: hypothetical protein K2M56_06345 [Muribaculaceae bacterium]|nr:hypothetical protein [Muribaculaceae bacterium]